MKHTNKYISGFFVTLLFSGMLFFATPLFADSPPPPPSHGQTGNVTPPGGGAPIGGGLFMLIGLAAAYGGKKIYDWKNSEVLQ